MLYLLALILFAFWIIALAFKVTVGIIHLALIAAVVLFIVALVRGRRTTTTVP